MAGDQQLFREAHAAWKKSTDEYEAMLQAIIQGKAVTDKEALLANCKEMRSLLDKFEAAQVGIVSWR
jgi:hypothetical protein